MECNRDEAARAREIANMKLSMEDFYEAKKFVLIARKLFPTLEGLSHMLHMLEVHTAAKRKVGGTEMDWYGILQVDPGADKGAIQKQYRKLVLFLHPDKNKVVGAEEAFKLVGNAWDTLSDKEKRAKHDKARNSFWTACPNCKKQFFYRRVYENQKAQCSVCKHNYLMRDIYSTASGHESTGNEETVGKEPGKETPSDNKKQSNEDTEMDTFSTACPHCKRQYEYRRKYENATMQCSECKHNFVMRDIQSTGSRHDSRGNESVGKKEAPSDKEKRAHHDTERDTFSSACPNCAKQYRYRRKYENARTHCSRCKHNFVIRDVSTASGDENLGNKERVGKKETPSDKEKRAHHDTERDTFSSACPICTKQYRYLRKYENATTHCSGCKHNFVIRDIHSTASGDECRGNEHTVEEEILEEEENVKEKETLGKGRDESSKCQQKQEEECRRADPRQSYAYPVYEDPTNCWAGCPSCKQYEQYEPECRCNQLYCPFCKHIFKASTEDLCTAGYNGRQETKGWFQKRRKNRGKRNFREKRQKQADDDLEKGCPNCSTRTKI